MRPNQRGLMALLAAAAASLLAGVILGPVGTTATVTPVTVGQSVVALSLDGTEILTSTAETASFSNNCKLVDGALKCTSNKQVRSVPVKTPSCKIAKGKKSCVAKATACKVVGSEQACTTKVTTCKVVKGKAKCSTKTTSKVTAVPATPKPTPTPTTPTPTPTPTTPAPTPTPTTPTTPGVITAPAYTPEGNANAYSFMNVDSSGRPAYWDKCKPIRLRVNMANATPVMVEDLNEALRRVSAASGLVFTYVGETNVIPYQTTNWYEGLYSETQDTDFYVAFTNASVISRLGGNTIGLAGPVWMTDGSDTAPKIILGGAVFDTEPADLKSGFGGVSRGSVMLHEIGHALNLGHVDENIQIMYPSLSSSAKDNYQAGDLAGLKMLNSFPCR